MNIARIIKNRMNSFQVILIGFAVLILAGALLLCLPISSVSRQSVPFLNALFTSASAACVTGLVVYDTATQWSLFGRAVILVLIQIGGLGVVTMIVLAMLATGKRIGIFQRLTMRDAISAPQLGGIIKFTQFFLKATAVIEGLGIVLLLPFFASRYGLLKGLGYAVFHSISAFCNAGFDLMGFQGKFSSFTHFAGDFWINAVIMILIIVGGLGYLTWEDLLARRFRFKQLRLQSKIILVTTALLILFPFLFFVLIEFRGLPAHERILVSLFQSVTPRTAGFNTVSYSDMSEAGQLLTVVLMLIGGAPGSTAGGMKVTTVFIVYASMHADLRQKGDVTGFRRRIEPDITRNAYTVLLVYITLLITGTLFMSCIEKLPVMAALFECASALGTVGLSTGITPSLSALSRIMLIIFMFLGRVGGITIAWAMLRSNISPANRYPAEKITVG